MAHANASHDGDAPPAVPVGRDGYFRYPNRRTFLRKMMIVPAYGWIVLLYVIGALALKDPYHVLEFDLPYIGLWKVTWVMFILGISAIVVAIELALLSKPGINQSDEVMAISICFVVQIVLVTIAYSTPNLSLFRTSEVMFLLIGNAVEAWAAYYINSNSLVRTFAPGPVT